MSSPITEKLISEGHVAITRDQNCAIIEPYKSEETSSTQTGGWFMEELRSDILITSSHGFSVSTYVCNSLIILLMVNPARYERFKVRYLLAYSLD